jgi:hypothetical protein
MMRVPRLLAQQRNGLTAARTAASQRRALRQALQRKLIRYLAAVGNLAAKDRRELAEQFRLPEGTASHEAFLNGVKGLLEKAGAQKDLLVSMGMPHTLLDDLGTGLGEFESTLQTSRTGAARPCRRQRRPDGDDHGHRGSGAGAGRAGAVSVRGQRRADERLAECTDYRESVPVQRQGR